MKYYNRYYEKDNPSVTWRGNREFDCLADAVVIGEETVKEMKGDVGFHVIEKEEK